MIQALLRRLLLSMLRLLTPPLLLGLCATCCSVLCSCSSSRSTSWVMCAAGCCAEARPTGGCSLLPSPPPSPLSSSVSKLSWL
jgi:hypothetical protein